MTTLIVKYLLTFKRYLISLIMMSSWQNLIITVNKLFLWKSETRVTSSNPRLRRLKARVARLKARVVRLKARVRRLKARFETIKPRVR